MTHPAADFAEVEKYRRSIQALAYRMLGSWADAEDVAQEAIIKWHRAEPEATIENPAAWLHKVATRICLDRLKSARRQREQYVGPWLPEPILAQEESPADQADVGDSITFALMLALERLSPAERAAFLLHDIFDYPFDTIAEILEKEPPACRQLAKRAREAIRAEKRRFSFDREQHRKLLAAFLKAISDGDAQGLEAILSDDVTLYSDGGGIAPAARKILQSRDIVTRLFLGLARKRKRLGSLQTSRFNYINNLPGVLLYTADGVLDTIVSIAVSEGRIRAIYQQRNPRKLLGIAKAAARLP